MAMRIWRVARPVLMHQRRYEALPRAGAAMVIGASWGRSCVGKERAFCVGVVKDETMPQLTEKQQAMMKTYEAYVAKLQSMGIKVEEAGVEEFEKARAAGMPSFGLDDMDALVAKVEQSKELKAKFEKFGFQFSDVEPDEFEEAQANTIETFPLDYEKMDKLYNLKRPELDVAKAQAEEDRLYDVNPTLVPGTMPDSFEQAAGLERQEIENKRLLAEHNSMIRGPFGTLDDPTYVPSAFDSRIVGCTGDEAPHDHDILWLLVEAGKPNVCPLCEQVFALKPVA